MLSDLQRVQLGAFLHDIGKFWQRTGEPHDSSYASFTKDDFGGHGAHAKWSASFFNQHVPSEFRQAAYPALYHHKPNDYISKIVAVADRLSALERDDSPGGAHPRQLVSPFCGIRLRSQETVNHKYYPLSALTIDRKIIFPTESAEDNVESVYRALWDAFLAEHRLLPKEDFDAYFHGLYHLLLKYAWCIPSAFYRDVPDISLFDHSRTTCAFATSLALQGILETDLDTLLSQEQEVRKEPMFTLIGGDLSGIQKFLYTLTAEGAARGLRGRSFYLQLLNDTVARWVLSFLGLSICNLLYCGGGRFYILAPLKAKESLPSLREQLSLKLLDAHGADLYLALDGIELSPASLSFEPGSESHGFGAMWRSIGERLNQAKRRKFAELAPEELHERIFNPKGSGGYARVCSICREEIPSRSTADSEKCTFCESLEELGRDLRDARYLVATEAEVDPKAPPTWRSVLAGFGASYAVCRDDQELRETLRTANRPTITSLGSSDFVRPIQIVPETARTKTSLEFSLYSPVAPRNDDGTIADFGTMADRSTGIKRLGILRMDVDDLGEIFGKGLGTRSTPSRLSSLSLLLRVYFEGWVSRLCADRNENSKLGQVYPIYSGGDDLLIVGSWSAIPELALEIQQHFARFVANNPDVHLSAGIVLEPKKFPLYQGAEHAHEALDDRAKQRTVNGCLVKDAIDFLGQTVSWEEFAKTLTTVRTLKKLIRENKVPKALVHTISSVYQQYEAANPVGKPKKIYFGRWMWLAAYSLTRMADRLRDQAVSQEIKRIQSELLDPVGISLAGLAARWAELLLRERD